MFISFPSMFRAIMCPSSGEITVSMRHLVFVILYGWLSGTKVKCTLVQALRLCTGRTAHRKSWFIAIPLHDHGSRRGWGVSVTPQPLFIPWKDTVPIVQRLGGPQAQSGQVRKISPHTTIRSPDRPVSNQSLCRLRYPAHTVWYSGYKKS